MSSTDFNFNWIARHMGKVKHSMASSATETSRLRAVMDRPCNILSLPLSSTASQVVAETCTVDGQIHDLKRKLSGVYSFSFLRFLEKGD